MTFSQKISLSPLSPLSPLSFSSSSYKVHFRLNEQGNCSAHPSNLSSRHHFQSYFSGNQGSFYPDYASNIYLSSIIKDDSNLKSLCPSNIHESSTTRIVKFDVSLIPNSARKGLDSLHRRNTSVLSNSGHLQSFDCDDDILMLSNTNWSLHHRRSKALCQTRFQKKRFQKRSCYSVFSFSQPDRHHSVKSCRLDEAFYAVTSIKGKIKKKNKYNLSSSTKRIQPPIKLRQPPTSILGDYHQAQAQINRLNHFNPFSVSSPNFIQTKTSPNLNNFDNQANYNGIYPSGGNGNHLQSILGPTPSILGPTPSILGHLPPLFLYPKVATALKNPNFIGKNPRSKFFRVVSCEVVCLKRKRSSNFKGIWNTNPKQVGGSNEYANTDDMPMELDKKVMQIVSRKRKRIDQEEINVYDGLRIKRLKVSVREDYKLVSDIWSNLVKNVDNSEAQPKKKEINEERINRSRLTEFSTREFRNPVWMKHKHKDANGINGSMNLSQNTIGNSSQVTKKRKRIWDDEPCYEDSTDGSTDKFIDRLNNPKAKRIRIIRRDHIKILDSDGCSVDHSDSDSTTTFDPGSFRKKKNFKGKNNRTNDTISEDSHHIKQLTRDFGDTKNNEQLGFNDDPENMSLKAWDETEEGDHIRESNSKRVEITTEEYLDCLIVSIDSLSTTTISSDDTGKSILKATVLLLKAFEECNVIWIQWLIAWIILICFNNDIKEIMVNFLELEEDVAAKRKFEQLHDVRNMRCGDYIYETLIQLKRRRSNAMNNEGLNQIENFLMNLDRSGIQFTSHGKVYTCINYDNNICCAMSFHKCFKKILVVIYILIRLSDKDFCFSRTILDNIKNSWIFRDTDHESIALLVCSCQIRFSMWLQLITSIYRHDFIFCRTSLDNFKNSWIFRDTDHENIALLVCSCQIRLSRWLQFVISIYCHDFIFCRTTLDNIKNSWIFRDTDHESIAHLVCSCQIRFSMWLPFVTSFYHHDFLIHLLKAWAKFNINHELIFKFGILENYYDQRNNSTLEGDSDQEDILEGGSDQEDTYFEFCCKFSLADVMINCYFRKSPSVGAILANMAYL